MWVLMIKGAIFDFNGVIKQEGESGLTVGLSQFLYELRANHIVRTIVSSGSKEMLEFYYQALHLSSWFEWETIVYRTNDLPSKPAPDPYLLALARLRLLPQEVVVFEDSQTGITAAIKAGVPTIVVVGNTSLPPLPQIKAHIPDFSQLEWKGLKYL